jgi:cellulose synthase/poly-beta-1,6-N-acetylglucosamine synthase-like glycosyltransferase
MMAALVLWTALGVVVYVYVGFPLLLFLLAKIVPRPVRKAPITPAVTMIIAAYNEEDVIAAKLDNTLALDYPPELLEILVASDGSTDRTNAIVATYAPRVRLLSYARAGKTSAQNHAVQEAQNEILLFSDASTVYHRGCVRAMVANFADPTVGSVQGALRYVNEHEAATGKGRDLYWRYEAAMRGWESDIYSIIGTTGAVYALRRALYEPLDPAAISDFVQPARGLLRGYRTVVEDDADAYEVTESKELGEELRRRARVILRGTRGVTYMPEIVNPLRHPWLCLQVFSHRLLRWAVPIFLLVALVANAFLLGRPGYTALFVLQVALYLLALVALALDRVHIRPPGLFIPLYFCLINAAPLMALWMMVKGEKKVFWDTGAQPAK